jgi:hypothetical protein
MINGELKKGRMNQAIPPSNDCYMRKLTVLSDVKKYVYTLQRLSSPVPVIQQNKK